MPEVTIVTAARLDSVDKVHWLQDTAKSIMEQELEDWEWVVVDDASPTAPDLPSDVRIRHQGLRAATHSGPAACRNTGVALARTDAIIILDADDMFASPKTLGTLHEAWKANKDRFVYGHMQIMDAAGQRKNVVKFGPYSFQDSLNTKGIVPVTAMHSVECWYKAGGWKTDLSFGLEDVEYWISAGAAGFCGLRLDETTLLYRRRTGQSRTDKMRTAFQQDAMKSLIMERHKDLYDGRYPMGCCGGGKTKPLPIANNPAAAMTPRMLADNPAIAGGKVWVRYNGARGAEFRVKGPVTGIIYIIQKHGDVFHIWAQDAHFFQSCGRGKDFTVGVPAPEVPEPEPEPEQRAEPEYQAEPPELATVQDLDPVAKAERGAPEPEPVQLNENITTAMADQGQGTSLTGITSLSDKAKQMMDLEGWTVEKLATADVDDLVPYPGVGKVTAARAIAEANRLVG